MQPSLTARERAAFKVKQPRTTQSLELLGLIVLILFLIAFCVDNFTNLTTVTPAHAATLTESTHQNAYYCDQLAHASSNAPMLVIGATNAQLKAVCANLK